MGEKLIRVALEIGQRKTFASAVDWPGWSRAGKDEGSAIQRLISYGERYSLAMSRAGVEFKPPSTSNEINVIAADEGNSTTDFGAPDLIVEQDYESVSSAQHDFFKDVLEACWQSFDHAVKLAQNKELEKGPRGGGRDLEAMIDHVVGADESYLYRIGWKPAGLDELKPHAKMLQLRQDIMQGLAAKIAGELPEEGPRGGRRWPARYFVRRVAWHALDHAWEIEDRIAD